MLSSINQINNQSFTARCPQIRDADWVCRKVNSFQHTSVTKFRKQILDFAVSKGALAQGQSVHDLRNLRPISDRNNFLLRLYSSYKNVVEKFSIIRASWKEKTLCDAKATDKMINQYKQHKIANCGEDAFLAAAIARMNEVENVYTACLTKNDKLLGHQVCIFNKDGSEFDGIIKPLNTIIIDPWLQKADFASLLSKEYKTSLVNFIDFDEVDKIEFSKKFIKKIDFTGMDTFLLRTKYPDLIFPYSGREFMQTKRP